MLPRFADNRDPNSLAARMRAKRNRWLQSTIDTIPRPMTILDVGGRPAVWESLKFVNRPDIHITLVNLEDCVSPYFNVSTAFGDARDLRQFHDKQFDLVYSNSVIEHVGGIEDMRRMANEIRRVAKRYFVQTPNRYFPIEPHFIFPLFQFLPLFAQIYLVRHFGLGWIPRRPDREEAEREVRNIRLLSKAEVRALFPDACLGEERVAGFVKSLLAYKIQPEA